MKFESNHIPYRERMRKGLGAILLSTFLAAFVLSIADLEKYYVYAAVFWLLFFLLNLYYLLRRFQKQIQSIEITDKEVLLSCRLKDAEQETLVFPLEDVRISIHEIYLPLLKPGRNYVLQIAVKRQGRYVTELEQSESGEWKLARFKEISKAYASAKDVPLSNASFQ